MNSRVEDYHAQPSYNLLESGKKMADPLTGGKQMRQFSRALPRWHGVIFASRNVCVMREDLFHGRSDGQSYAVRCPLIALYLDVLGVQQTLQEG